MRSLRPVESTRIDKWVWAVRLTKTRSDATDACRGGHVKLNGATAKPAATVRVGDRVVVRLHGMERDVEVVQLIDKRVGPPVAATCFLDHTPPPAAVDQLKVAPRDRGQGRPTKRERRDIDRFRGRP